MVYWSCPPWAAAACRSRVPRTCAQLPCRTDVCYSTGISSRAGGEPRAGGRARAAEAELRRAGPGRARTAPAPPPRPTRPRAAAASPQRGGSAAGAAAMAPPERGGKVSGRGERAWPRHGRPGPCGASRLPSESGIAVAGGDRRCSPGGRCVFSPCVSYSFRFSR